MYKNRYVRRAVAEVAGLDIEQIFLAPPVSDGAGFTLALPPGVTWTEEQSQPGDEQGNPVAPLVVNLPVWTWYQAEYPELANREQPTPEEVAAWAPEPDPEPAPLTDVDRARQYAEAYAAAEQIIFLLMGRVAPALVVGGFFTPETVNAEGTRFMAFHRDLIIDFKNSGRHPDAGTALYNAIAATPSTTAFPWLLANGGAILAIFGNGLPRNA